MVTADRKNMFLHTLKKPYPEIFIMRPKRSLQSEAEHAKRSLQNEAERVLKKRKFLQVTPPVEESKEEIHPSFRPEEAEEKQSAPLPSKSKLTKAEGALLMWAETGKRPAKIQGMSPKVNINCTTPEGWTPLMQAAGYGHVEVVSFLLKKGADVDQTDEAGYTALMFAAEKGYAEIVDLLLEYGAAVNCSLFKEKVTPLMFAAKNGNKHIVARLYAANPHAIDLADHLGFTALMLAVQGDHAEAVQFLLGKPIALEKKDKEGWTAFGCAIDRVAGAKYTKTDIISLFLSKNKALINQRFAQTHATPLMLAAETGELELVEFLLQQGADSNASNTHGSTALILAAYSYKLSVVARLLKQEDIDAEKTNIEGKSALQYLEERIARIPHEEVSSRAKGLAACVAILEKCTHAVALDRAPAGAVPQLAQSSQAFPQPNAPSEFFKSPRKRAAPGQFKEPVPVQRVHVVHGQDCTALTLQGV